MVRPPFWVGWRLIHLAVTRWAEFHGTVLLRTGHDPLELPLPSLLHLIYAWGVEGATAKDTARFDQQLNAPPVSADLQDRAEWSDDETDGSFALAVNVIRGNM